MSHDATDDLPILDRGILRDSPRSFVWRRILTGLIWLAIFAVIGLCVFSASGCSGERAQAGADARAGVAAAMPHTDPKGQQILAGVDARLPAATGVPSKEWPAPIMGPEAIEFDPPKYIQSAPPEPKGWTLKALAIGAALIPTILYGIKILAPALPGGGPVVAGIADMAWKFLSSRDQRRADEAHSTVVADAKAIAPLLPLVRGGLPGHLQPTIDRLIATTTALTGIPPVSLTNDRAP